MRLVELTLNAYLDTLASDAPAPGGGSASALAGAQGAGLVAMVGRLTAGKKKYAEFHDNANAVIEEAEEVKAELIKSIDRDTDAYQMVTDAFALPKETDEQAAKRRQAIDEGMLCATKVPYETMLLSLRGLKVAEKLVGKCNTNAISDLGVGALNLLACTKGAWYNVLINLGSLKDESLAAQLKSDGEKMMNEALEIAGRLEQAVLGQL